MSRILLSIQHTFSTSNNEEEAYVYACTHLSQRAITPNSLEQSVHTRGGEVSEVERLIVDSE